MKRLVNAILLAIALLVSDNSAGEKARAQPAEAAIPEADLLDTFGVNVHLNYTDGAYADLDRVTADMRYLGLVHIRTHDGGDVVPLDSYAKLASQGLHFNLIATPDQMDRNVDFAAGLEARVPGSITSVEGFNEINNWPFAYRGLQGEDAARAAQAVLYAKVKGRKELAHVPVLYFTGGQETDHLSGMADIANVHAYTNNALQPRPFILNAMRLYRGGAAELPRANTEFGSFTLPKGWPDRKPYWANPTDLGVDETTQAKIVLNTFFEGAELHLARSYVYELLDQKPDPEGSNAQFHFGLFTFDHKPKLSAQALHRVTRFFGSPRSAISAGTVQAKLESTDPTIGSVAVRRSDGSLVVALWNRSEFWRWDQSSSERTNPPPQPVTLFASGPRGRIVAGLFDPLENTSRSVGVRRNGAISVDVPNYPVLLHLRIR